MTRVLCQERDVNRRKGHPIFVCDCTMMSVLINVNGMEMDEMVPIDSEWCRIKATQSGQKSSKR